MRKLLLVLILAASTLGVFAQNTPYTDQVFTPAIKTVEFYNTKKEQSFPLIELNSSQQLLLAFDDLRGSSRNFYYTVEHCDENWNPTNIAQSEYLQGFNEDQIRDYNYSSSTVQKYTHYELKYPNQYLAAPKISGNYVLKVYEDGDKSRMALIRRFYVLDPKVSMMAEVAPSNDNSLRQTNQKINFQIDCGNLRVQNPNYDIKALVVQNRRPETAVMNTQPASIQGNRLIYNDVNTNDFLGLNEFRHFDTRTLKLNSDRVGHIYKDTANTVVLLTDFTQNQPNYAFYYDNNGKFFPGNSDGSDPRIDADYAHMYFTLASTKSPDEGSAYIVGMFNNYQLNDSNKLYYDLADRHFHIQMLMKQGVYDYEYVWLPKGAQKPDDTAFAGSHYETENEYQIFVYYHPAGARWTELVGYRPLNTTPKR